VLIIAWTVLVCLSIVQVVLIILKLFGQLDWSWFGTLFILEFYLLVYMIVFLLFNAKDMYSKIKGKQ